LPLNHFPLPLISRAKRGRENIKLDQLTLPLATLPLCHLPLFAPLCEGGWGGAKKRPDPPKKIIKIQPEIKNKERF